MRTNKELIRIMLENFDKQYDSNYGLCMFTIRLCSLGIITPLEEAILDAILMNNKPLTIYKGGAHWWKLGGEGTILRKEFLEEIYSKL